MTNDGVLIVIPCLNEASNLPFLLAQMSADNPQALIVVADGGSTDGSRAIVADFARTSSNVMLMDNPDRLQSAGVNRAVMQFGEEREWLVRVDAHCRYPESYAERLVEVARQTHAVSVVVPMVSDGRTCFQKGSAAAQNTVLGSGGSPHRHVGTSKFVDHGHHALMRLEQFRLSGGYDVRLSHNEDAELDARLRKSGGTIWLETSLPLIYFPRSTPGALFRQYWSYGKGRAVTRHLHRERLHLRQLLPLAVPTAAVLALATPITLLAAIPLLFWLLLTLLVGLFLTGGDKSPCARLCGVAAAIMHFGWGWGFIIQSANIAAGIEWKGAKALEGTLRAPGSVAI